MPCPPDAYQPDQWTSLSSLCPSFGMLLRVWASLCFSPERVEHHPGRGCRHAPLPSDQEEGQARGAPGRQLPPDRHPREQLHQQRRAQDLRAHAVQLRVPEQASLPWLAYSSNMGGYQSQGFVRSWPRRQSPDNPNWFQVSTRATCLPSAPGPRGFHSLACSSLSA